MAKKCVNALTSCLAGVIGVKIRGPQGPRDSSPLLLLPGSGTWKQLNIAVSDVLGFGMLSLQYSCSPYYVEVNLSPFILCLSFVKWCLEVGSSENRSKPVHGYWL